MKNEEITIRIYKFTKKASKTYCITNMLRITIRILPNYNERVVNIVSNLKW
jgi:hypothetical protein